MSKIRKILPWFIWTSIIAMLIFSYLKPSGLDVALLSEFECFDSYEKISINSDVYRISEKGVNIGYMAFGEAYGYQSDILVGVVISEKGNILETRIMKQNETPSFINKIYNADFLKRQFKDKPIEEGFTLSKNITAVSGATISSRAITSGVTEASQLIAEGYLNTEVDSHVEIKFGLMEAALLGMMVLALLSYKLKNQKLRYLTMSYSIILLGFKYKQFIAYSWIVSLLLGKAPSFADNIGWYILIVGTVLFITLTGRNIYCSHICPFGALQEAGKKLSGFDFFKINPKMNKRFRELPSVLAYIAFTGAVLTEQMGIVSYEPFSLIYGRTGSGIQWALLPLILIMSLFVMRFYCSYACPVGVVLNLSVKARRFVSDIYRDRGSNKVNEAILHESKKESA